MIPKQIADPAARAFVPWPAELLEQLRVALRRQLETNDAEWANFIRDTAVQFPLERRVKGTQAFLQRLKPGKAYRPAYVFAMIRDGAEPTPMNGNGRHTPDETWNGTPSVEATEEMLAKRRARKTVPMPEHMRTKK